jgi:hypothetical protein
MSEPVFSGPMVNEAKLQEKKVTNFHSRFGSFLKLSWAQYLVLQNRPER